MFDNYTNYDSLSSDREREEKLMQDKRERCHKEGKLYFILFWLTVVGTPVILLLSLIGGVAGAVFDTLFDSMALFYVVIGGISLISLVIGIIIAVVLFMLGQEESCFRVAAISYILLVLFETVSEFLPDGLLKSVLGILTLIAELFYLFEFINGSMNILAGVDNYLASSWETIRKFIIYFFIAIVAIVILMFIPVIRVIALIGAFAAAIAAIVILIWEWILMFKTASALKNF